MSSPSDVRPAPDLLRRRLALSLVPVVPVVVLDDLDHAVPVARALVAGGLPVIELTLRTPVALDAIAAIAAEVPEILVGAGTITSPELVSRRREGRGAVPRLSRHDARAAARDGRTGVPFLPGTATVSEAMAVLEAGFSAMKFFPAEAPAGRRT